MKDALLDREDCNVILVDWSRGARHPYGQAAGNTRLVGAQAAVLIRFLISSTSRSSNRADRFYIVGFSLGAHTAGYAGSNMRAHGMLLGRITGKVSELNIMISYCHFKMNAHFPFGFSGWEFWTSAEDVPFISEIFRSTKPNWPFHLHSNRNFRIFLVNGKHSKYQFA